MSWDLLNTTYQRKGLVLALGAGVSKCSDIPSWEELLARLVAKCVPNGNEDRYNELRSQGLSPEIIASIIEEHCGKRDIFIKEVRDALYQDYPYYKVPITKSNRKRIAGYIRKNNQTLRTVGSLCAIRNPGKTSCRRNPRIHAIVSLNLDALLQVYIKNRYDKYITRTVERATAETHPERDQINVYHMHGYLVIGEKIGDKRTEAADSVVLTEQDYFDFINNPNLLYNYTFLYLMREFNVLFVGLSMLDENIRRMLHYSKKERLENLDQNELSKDELRKEIRRHFVIMRRSGDGFYDRSLEESLDPLGTQVLWVDDYDEIPVRLGAMYGNAGDDWAKVY